MTEPTDPASRVLARMATDAKAAKAWKPAATSCGQFAPASAAPKRSAKDLDAPIAANPFAGLRPTGGGTAPGRDRLARRADSLASIQPPEPAVDEVASFVADAAAAMRKLGRD